MSEIKQIKEEIISFILNHKDYPTSKEMSKQYPYTDNNLKAFYELVIKGIIFYSNTNDMWMVIKKGD